MSDVALFEEIKPAYSVEDMVSSLSHDNGLTAVSTFSGCGGSSLGLRRAGWRIPYAVEFIDEARATYQANFPSTYVDARDIRTIKGAEILERIGKARGELDLLEGSPPCSSFSTINSRDAAAASRFGYGKVKAYSGKRQATDDLFFEFLRLVDELNPRAVIAENVVGLNYATTNGKVVEHGEELSLREVVTLPANVLDSLILEPLRDMGYRVFANRKVSASTFGAATSRSRVYIHAYRSDLDLAPQAPRSTGHAYTIGDALNAMPGERDKRTGRVEPDLEQFRAAAGVAANPWQAVPWSLLKPGEHSDSPFQLYRCGWDQHLPAVAARYYHSGTGPMHPDVCRLFTVDEIKWMSTFPLDFITTGTYAQQAERIGRAVVPAVYEAYGRMIADDLKRAAR